MDALLFFGRLYGLALISRGSDDDDVVLVPDETTGETAVRCKQGIRVGS